MSFWVSEHLVHGMRFSGCWGNPLNSPAVGENWGKCRTKHCLMWSLLNVASFPRAWTGCCEREKAFKGPVSEDPQKTARLKSRF